jgi:hypothetical protein
MILFEKGYEIMKYVVELNDVDGNHFQIEMHMPWLSSTTDTGNSTWKALDSGFIKYHSGGCEAVKKGGFEPTDIRLVEGDTYGIQIFKFFDWAGLVNSSGAGEADQPWVVNFKAGSFGWTLIS